MSFLARPGLDFTVSSFGGSVELSAIPVAFAWMNASLQFVLSQVALNALQLLLINFAEVSIDSIII